MRSLATKSLLRQPEAEPPVKPVQRPQWREVLTVPVSNDSTVSIWFQGVKWTRNEYEAVCLFIQLLDHFTDNSRLSANTDDESGWWKELYFRDKQ